MAEKKSVLITGGTGLVGSHAAAYLLERGEKVIVFDVAINERQLSLLGIQDKVTVVRGDILDFPYFLETLQKHDVGKVAHLAGFIGEEVDRRPFTGIRVNLMGTAHVLEAARILKLDRVVLSSSSTVFYGNMSEWGNRPVDESIQPSSLSVYAATKVGAEQLGYAYANRYGVDFIALRYAAIIGPGSVGMKAGREQSVFEMVRKSVRGEPVSIQWNGGERQEWYYMKDASWGTALALMATGLEHRLFHLGNGETQSIDELVALIEKKLPGAKISLTKVPRALGYPTSPPPLDISRARKALGYEPRYPLEKAIEDYIATVRLMEESSRG